jgi:hypothetical protein
LRGSRKRQNIRELRAPATIFRLTGHGRFTLGAQRLHSGIIKQSHYQTDSNVWSWRWREQYSERVQNSS